MAQDKNETRELVIHERYLPKECYTSRSGTARVLTPKGCIIHYNSGKWAFPDDLFNIDKILGVLVKYRLSYHFIIDREGNIFQLVPLEYQAWHAGASRLNGIDWCNSFCYGVSFASTGFEHNGRPAYEDAQIESGALLLAYLGIPDKWTKGHHFVRENWLKAYPDKKINGTRPKTKHDPGTNFPWGTFIELKNQYYAGGVK